MPWLGRLRSLFRSRQLDAELDEEVRHHLEMRAAELQGQGLRSSEAHSEARRRFGNLAQTKEETRAFETVPWLETMLLDLRYGLRQLAHNRGFAFTAVLTLALGIGANTAIFTVVNAVLLKPLPYPQPGQLVSYRGNHSMPDIVDLGLLSTSTKAVAAYANWPLDLISNGVPQRVDTAIVGGDMFAVLGVKPFRGGVFDEKDDAAGKAVVVVSYGFWRSDLGGREEAVGAPLVLSGKSYTVVGVMPPSFRLPGSMAEVWVPLRVGYPEAALARGARFMYAMARLRDGVSLAQYNAELVSIGKHLGELHPADARTFSVTPLRDRFTGDVRTPLLVLLGAVGLVLLIACANYATLLLARGASRREEMQVRSALGARTSRLVRQLLTESVTVAVISGACGILIAYLGLQGLLALKPADLPQFSPPTLDRTALSFTLFISLLTGIIFGTVPAWQTARRGRFVPSGFRVLAGRSGARRVLVVAELALALMLLAGAGLLLRSLWRLQEVPSGMNPDGVLTMRLMLPRLRYTSISAQEEFFRRLDENLAALPNVQVAGSITELPLGGMRMMHNMIIEGQPAVPEGHEPEIYTHEVTPGYFAAIGTELKLGRSFTAQDNANNPLVGIINEAFARKYYGDGSPLGARIRWARAPLAWMTIVGVARDVRFESLESEQEPTLYTPMMQKQMPWKTFGAPVIRVRAGDPIAVAEAAKKAVWAIDPLLPVTDVEPMTLVMEEAMAQRRFNTLLLACFAGLALVLAMMGVYGVIAYLVAQRTQEVGIRMALGAQRGAILWLMICQGLPLVGLGVLLGSAGALASSQALRKLLYGTSATDPVIFAAVAGLMALIALLSILVPAARASRIDPMTALHYE